MGEINHIMLANKHVIYSISTPNLLMWTLAFSMPDLM